MTLDSWKRIVLDPCNRSAQRRNEAATRDAFQEIVNYITNNNTTITGDGTIVFFEVTATSIGSATTTAIEIVTPGFTPTGRTFTLYDYTPDLRFAQNFVDGYLGCGRLSEDIAANAVVVIELEGKARYIDGTLTANMVAGAATADVTNYWGAYPNIHTPGATVTVQDRNNFGPNAKNGDYYLAVWDEQLQEYVVVMIDDHELILFQVNAAPVLGDPSVAVTEVIVNNTTPPPTFLANGRVMTAYDPTPNLRFAQNFVEGYRGVGRHAPEIDNESIVIIELEGKARFIDGTLAANVAAGSASCNVANYWGAYPNVGNPGTPVTVYDREGYASTAKSGEKYLAVWDEQDQKYIFILPSCCECTSTGLDEFVKLCNKTANECCLWDAMIYRPLESTTDFCLPKRCYKPIWLWCYQGVDPLQEFPLGVGAADDLGSEGVTAHWCGMAHLIKRGHACGGDTRDVYGVDCGDCYCTCPSQGDVVTVTIPAESGCWDEIVFPAYCVDNNPMSGLGGQGFWGEFSVTGYYPVVAQQVTIDPITVASVEYTEVYVVFGCNGSSAPTTLAQLCSASIAYILKADGSYELYTGTFNIIAPGFGGGWVPILDGSDCQIYCTRTYRYGMFLQCTNASFTGTNVYLLPPEGEITRVDIGCGTDVVQTPSATQYWGDGDGITRSSQLTCCMPKTAMLMDDGLFGGGTACTHAIVQDVGATYSADPYYFHVFGGCKTILAQHRAGAGGIFENKLCGITAHTGGILFYVVWGNESLDLCVD